MPSFPEMLQLSAPEKTSQNIRYVMYLHSLHTLSELSRKGCGKPESLSSSPNGMNEFGEFRSELGNPKDFF